MCYDCTMNKLTQFKVVLVATVSTVILGSLWLTADHGTRTVTSIVAHGEPTKLADNNPVSDSILLPNRESPITLSSSEFTCLARNIYFESGIEPLEGKIAVAQVTFNRLHSGRWGKTVCEVVMAKKQFSWTANKTRLSERPSGALWDSSVAAAQQYLSGTRIYNLDRSTHYHADWIDSPRWTQNVARIKQIGQHIFYADLR